MKMKRYKTTKNSYYTLIRKPSIFDYIKNKGEEIYE